ncbi:MAG: 3-hydroxyanthranilate 3,4-dioxygenase [Bacteriovoracales bacterium]|nr:3-hydroxyanthranilate 3,4-dioxygenase [Bacteriovoracales bacterium]
MIKPFSLQHWIDEHRDILKPPVGNKVVFRDSTFFVMVVGGPNERTDFHVNESDEFFYQLEGAMVLRIISAKGEMEDIVIGEGEVFMLKAKTPHSPQRRAETVGLVVEKVRTQEEQDGLQWYCEKCYTKLYEEFFHLTDIETQFQPVFKRYEESGLGACRQCGHRNGKTWSLRVC